MKYDALNNGYFWADLLHSLNELPKNVDITNNEIKAAILKHCKEPKEMQSLFYNYAFCSDFMNRCEKLGYSATFIG